MTILIFKECTPISVRIAGEEIIVYRFEFQIAGITGIAVEAVNSECRALIDRPAQ